MQTTTTAEYVLWGYRPGVWPWTAPLKLTGGTLRQCRTEQAQRTRDNQGWRCAIYRKGTAPVGLRLLAEQDAAVS